MHASVYVHSNRRCGGLRRHRSLLRHRFEVVVARTIVSETSTRFLSLATRPHDAVTMEPLRLVTINGVGSNGVESLPVFCRRTRKTSPSFRVVVFALVRLSARDFIFSFAAVFPRRQDNSLYYSRLRWVYYTLYCVHLQPSHDHRRDIIWFYQCSLVIIILYSNIVRWMAIWILHRLQYNPSYTITLRIRLVWSYKRDGLS